MSNQIEVFNFNQNQVKLLQENNQPFFSLIDVCDVFGIQNSRRVMSEMLDAQGVRQAYALAKDGKQRKMAFISEPNLYRIIFKSDKPIAVDFQNWVFDEVLPTIRKTGSYTLTINPQQQQAIKQAVNERHHRTGEHYQAIYAKMYAQFNVPRYQEIKSSQFEEVMRWLGANSQKEEARNSEMLTLAHEVQALYNEHLRKPASLLLAHVNYNITTKLMCLIDGLEKSSRLRLTSK